MGCCRGPKVDAQEDEQAVEKKGGSEGKKKNALMRPCPEEKTNCISKLFFFWITKLIVQGYKRPLNFEDLWRVAPRDASNAVVPRLEKQWQKQITKTGWRFTDPRHTPSDDMVVGSTKAPEKDGASPGTRRARTVSEAEGADTMGSEIPHVAVLRKERAEEPSLWNACIGGFGLYYMGAGVLKILADAINFINPQLLGLMIAFIGDSDAPVWKGYVLALGMFGTSFIRTVISQWYWHMSFRTGMQLRTSVLGAIYRKALRLSSSARRNASVGEIVNLMSVDAQRLQDAPTYLHNLWTGPIVLIVALYFLWLELGPSSLAGLGVMVLLLPFNAAVAAKLRKLQISQMKDKDQRLNLTNEVLNGIKVLKLYAWEDAFSDRLSETRSRELKNLRSIALLGAGTSLSFTLAPVMVALASFATYVLSSDEHVLDADKAFVSLSLFNLMNHPLSLLPNVISMSIQTNVSINRISKFLKSEELDPKNVTDHEGEESAIRIKKANFSWGNDDAAVLKNICIRVAPGKLIAVVGQVGMGKTSFMSAILGEMHVQSGSVHNRGVVAYVPQQAWIQNATVKANILFGKEHYAELYDTVIDACALKTDLEILTAGDATEIGEKGINLSGGQKQRISIARAVYQSADTYLLDDPLSAVDSHVGKHIFDKVIGPEGVLRSKTRVLVTNSLWVLPHVDEVIVLHDGMITERGPYQDLLDYGGPFADFIATYLSEIDPTEDEDEVVKEMRRKLMRRISSISQSKLALAVDDNDDAPGGLTGKEDFCLLEDKDKYLKAQKKEVTKKLIEKEKEETGAVKWSVINAYFRACGYCPVLCVLVAFIFNTAARVATNVWLSEWSDDSLRNTTMETQDEIDDRRDLRLIIYGVLGIAQGVAVLSQTFAVAVCCLGASRLLHGNLLHSILRAPMSFFDTTPMGRVINRFSKDIDTLDLSMPMSIRFFLLTFSSVMTTLFVISYSTPIFLAAVVPMSVVYYFIQRFYIAASRQLKRIDSVQRSPIYGHFGESVSGASSIRAYGRQEQFTDISDDLVDNNNMVYYPSIVCNRWLGLYLEILGSVIVLFAGIFVVVQRTSISPGDAGLSLSYSLQITVMLNYMVRAMCDLENYIVSAERVEEYAEGEQEAPAVVPDHRPPLDWPSGGEVEFYDYALRYRPGLDLVIKGIDAHIRAGEKVGIVGRTGAGKSSLTLALFRIIEAADGIIKIDGLDISEIGLKDLRSKISIIPQDPVVFSGTLRTNLDPTGDKTDEELWSVLELAHMKEFVKTLPDTLDFMCSEGGENVSVGQRQLLCLARALIRKTKVLVLDEATAAVDMATDDLIQTTIRTEFADCTVLTIAHRLNTILDYDRIMVLDQGRVAEMASPTELRKRKDGIFRGMLQDAGLLKDDKNPSLLPPL